MNVRESKDRFEVYALVPGLLREEVVFLFCEHKVHGLARLLLQLLPRQAATAAATAVLVYFASSDFPLVCSRGIKVKADGDESSPYVECCYAPAAILLYVTAILLLLLLILLQSVCLQCLTMFCNFFFSMKIVILQLCINENYKFIYMLVFIFQFM